MGNNVICLINHPFWGPTPICGLTPTWFYLKSNGVSFFSEEALSLEKAGGWVGGSGLGQGGSLGVKHG